MEIIPEKDIGIALEEIKNWMQRRKDEFLEILQYRAEHSYEEFKEKYGYNSAYSTYKHYCDCLEEYEQVKDLPNDNPRQIRFILDYSGLYNTGRYADIYIKGKGYGEFDNPYFLYDFYSRVDRHRFPQGTNFLINRLGERSNYMELDKLDVDMTVENIGNLTQVWEYVIFCEDNPMYGSVYTTDSIRHSSHTDRFMQIPNLKEALDNIKNYYSSEDYVVEAIDFHY